ncbi:MAG: hypothetical protein KC609_14190 [Myxococcales bacterium]|nr:hypothetical protein [Myxococcales bacterium]
MSARILVLVLLAVTSCGGAAAATSRLKQLIPPTAPSRWSDQRVDAFCRKARHALDNQPEATKRRLATRYSSYPYPSDRRFVTKAPHYWVQYRRAWLPIPARPYRVGVLYRAPRREFSLVLRFVDGSGALIFDRMFGSKPLHNIFAMAPTRPATSDEKAYTQRLFGRYPNLFDLRDLGFRVTPRSFRCDRTNLMRAIRDLVVLILKAVGGPPLDSLTVYQQVGFPRSILEVGRRKLGVAQVRYTFELAGNYYTLDALDRKQTLASLVRVLGLAGTTKSAVLRAKKLPEAARRLIRFVNAPTKAEARRLLADLPTLKGVEESLLRRELVRYLR